MLDNMRRLHPRGAANRGICVDADGAMLGPDCVLVQRTPRGYRTIDREDASALQKCLFDTTRDQDWLLRQCQRIANALNTGEIALAQIYGLHIPVGELDDFQLWRIALAKANFNPDEPRIPKGEPHGGAWTASGGSSAPDDSSTQDTTVLAELRADPTDATAPAAVATPRGFTSGDGQGPSSSPEPPMSYRLLPPQSVGTGPPLKPAEIEFGPTTLDSPDLQPDPTVRDSSGNADDNPILTTPGIDAINSDHSLENLLFFLATRGSRGVLRSALKALGLLRDRDQAHHIVPQWDSRTDPARKVLERFGIDINDPVNGVGLPPEQHWPLNANAYHESINRALAGATTRSEAEDILRLIARRLREGTWP